MTARATSCVYESYPLPTAIGQVRSCTLHFKKIAGSASNGVGQSVERFATALVQGTQRGAWMGLLGGDVAHSAIPNPALVVEAEPTHKGMVSATFGRSRSNVEGPLQPDTGRSVGRVEAAGLKLRCDPALTQRRPK